MKNLRYLFSLMAFVILMPGCIPSDEAEPIPITNITYGALVRTVQVVSGTYNRLDFTNSAFTVIVEVDDEQGGDLLESIDVYVKRRRGTAVTNEVLVRNIPKSAFTKEKSPKTLVDLPRTTISVTGPEVLSRLNLTAAQMNGGDFIEFRLVLKQTNGRQFTDKNVNGDVSGGAFFSSPYFYRATVVCPSNLAGTFNYSTTNVVTGPGGSAAACGPARTGTVTLAAVAGTPGSYTISDASFGVFACAYGDTPPGGTLRLNDACGKLSFSGTDKYGDAYTLTFVSNNGTNLVFDWVNTWGDAGRTTLTAPTPGFWPSGLN
jgi:hypothetical protein